MYLIGQPQSVDLVDLDTSAIIHTFRTEKMQPRTLKHICFLRPHQSGVASLILAYTSAETGDLVIHSYLSATPDDISPTFPPPEPPATRPPSPWSQMQETIKRISNPGAWEALPNGSIVGIRRKQSPASPPSPTVTSSPILGALRRRRPSSSFSTSSSTTTIEHPNKDWEAWVLNRPDTKGDFETRPLDEPPAPTQTPPHSRNYRQHHHQSLMIAELGPMVRVGTMSVALGFGDVVKVVSVGHEHFDRSLDGSLGLGLGLGGESLILQQTINLSSRRKKASAASGRLSSSGGGGTGAWGSFGGRESGSGGF